MIRVRGRRTLQFVFGVYAGITLMLTHYPQLTIPVPGRPDLVAHMGLFGLWTLFCCACGWFGPALSETNIWRSGGVSLVYSGLDEWSQGIPAIRRFAALDDFGANALGVIAATALMLLAGRILGTRTGGSGTMPPA
ncbi:MAG: hypothetical protein IT435_16425 [Phycisphaerales bacterium]|nr:hypothetical protein [Phycisphaerales bacterium]